MLESTETMRSGGASHTPVVLAIFDELPVTSLMDARGGIDADSFPSFGRLASTSTWYRNATTVADGTYLAVPSILSGQRPISDLPTARRYPDNIFTLLGGHHNLHVLEPITRVCGACDDQRSSPPASQRLGALLSDLAVVEGHLLLPRDLAESLPPIDRDYEDFAGQGAGVQAPSRHRPARGDRRRSPRRIAGDDLFADRLRDAERFVRRLAPSGRRPPAVVAHFLVPHVPWRLLPSGAQHPVGGPALPGSTDRVWSRNHFLVEQAMQRHLLQVGYADRLLGQLVARLQAAGLWDRALVIVAADHGIGLRPGGSRRQITRNDFAAIPLFVKGPGQRKGRVAYAPARTTDIMPTIASILDVRDPPRFDGVPLTARGRPSVPNPWLRVRQGRSGQLVSVRFDTFVRTRDAELARQRRSFPHGLRSLSRIGPNRWLLGRRVRSLRVGHGPLQVHIDHDNGFANVDHHSGVAPVYVTGHFTGRKEGGVPLALGVNGRIAAVGASYPVRDATRFSMLIPSQSLRPGRNVVEVFAVAAGRLLRLGRAPP
jgi:Sulfatase